MAARRVRGGRLAASTVRSATTAVALTAAAAALACAACACATPVVTAITPASGGEQGGFDVVISGRGLPFFSRDAVVYVGDDRPCGNVAMVTPFEALRCTMPACAGCGSVRVRVRAAASGASGGGGGGGELSNGLAFEYTASCSDALRPQLPARYSAAENCTVCRHVVTVATSLANDIVSHQGLREALRDSCSTQLVRSFGRVNSTMCHADYSAACAILVHSFGTALADAMWAAWDIARMYGALPDLACAAVGRCAPL